MLAGLPQTRASMMDEPRNLCNINSSRSVLTTGSRFAMVQIWIICAANNNDTFLRRTTIATVDQQNDCLMLIKCAVLGGGECGILGTAAGEWRDGPWTLQGFRSFGLSTKADSFEYMLFYNIGRRKHLNVILIDIIVSVFRLSKWLQIIVFSSFFSI